MENGNVQPKGKPPATTQVSDQPQVTRHGGLSPSTFIVTTSDASWMCCVQFPDPNPPRFIGRCITAFKLAILPSHQYLAGLCRNTRGTINNTDRISSCTWDRAHLCDCKSDSTRLDLARVPISIQSSYQQSFLRPFQENSSGKPRYNRRIRAFINPLRNSRREPCAAFVHYTRISLSSNCISFNPSCFSSSFAASTPFVAKCLATRGWFVNVTTAETWRRKLSKAAPFSRFASS